MEVYTGPDGALRWDPQQEMSPFPLDREGLEVTFSSYGQPLVNVWDPVVACLMKGGKTLGSGGKSFEDYGLFEEGVILETGSDENSSDRRYLIADSLDEEVTLSTWTKFPGGPDEEGYNGKYGEQIALDSEQAEVIRKMARNIISSAKKFVDQRLSSNV